MYTVVVIGATGNVGKEIIKILEERNFPVENLYALASPDSIGKKVFFKNQNITVQSFADFNFDKIKVDLVFSCVGGNFPKENLEKIASTGTIVIDKSSYFRMDPEVPLIIPEVNPEDILKCKKGIIASPNCTVTPLLMILKPLHDKYKVKRVVVSSYQAVSGTGKKAMDELYRQTKQFYESSAMNLEEIENKKGNVYPKRIAFNCIPQCDSFDEKSGYTKEELKMTNETKKILDPNIQVVATCVRVPVFNCHSESINIEFENEIDKDLEVIYEVLEENEGITIVDTREDGGYVTPYEFSQTDQVYVSRVRFDDTVKNGLNLWCVCDNIRKGAALNGVQIAELLIKKNII